MNNEFYALAEANTKGEDFGLQAPMLGVTPDFRPEIGHECRIQAFPT